MYTPEEFDTNKTKVLKYVLYKKRTKQEIKNKFCHTIGSKLLEDIMENLEENGYINDIEYITRTINEFKALNHLSMKEIRYKLYAKGVGNDLVENYFAENIEELKEYEAESAKIIAIKKSELMQEQEITQYLLKKGYTGENVAYAIESLKDEKKEF